ncbi:xylulokinase [Thermoflavifilum thermophilum]|uniref:Xylulokinase n=1 Tax=Thermoflavifilum thermophilum TaxID=1393122 RepID=A0A1I7N0J5_9BACT|nr:FGGY family carbohydrate kinase [Thermoflavifilum thermophilum]SFV28148.1 xylulokinase [Thermoflavifilum thermophilum]
MAYLLGFDVGSSSVKASLVDAETGRCVASAFSPSTEMPMQAPQPGWAEQDPERWWQELVNATHQLQAKANLQEVRAIGISYQMHGLVCVDRHQRVLRPAIIWCDSRAVDIGRQAFEQLGESFCLQHLLNSPGNFTASKLRWVKLHEPHIYEQIQYILLPGDYIAMRLTGEPATTLTGLSEGIWWDYATQQVSEQLLRYYEIDKQLLPPLVPVFGEQGRVTKQAAEQLHIPAGIPVSYRAGDQPNNAFSLKVLHPGEAAATAGTSAVIYSVTDRAAADQRSRINTFIHVTHQPGQPRYGLLLCINGAGILNSWLRKYFNNGGYEDMNLQAAQIEPGADGLLFFPFGNGAERVLENRLLQAHLMELDLNRHSSAHVFRAAQEGVVFALKYGHDILQQTGSAVQVIRAGMANMFLSPVFREIFTHTTGAVLELYETDGAQGAARAAGIGAGLYASWQECFTGMHKVMELHPENSYQQRYAAIYEKWKNRLQQIVDLKAH